MGIVGSGHEGAGIDGQACSHWGMEAVVLSFRALFCLEKSLFSLSNVQVYKRAIATFGLSTKQLCR